MKTEKCPVEQALQVIGGKWKIPIIHHLNEKPHRFGKLKSRLTKVTQQMLSKQLKEMENDGLVKRTVLSVMPPSVEYSLTDFGKSAIFSSFFSIMRLLSDNTSSARSLFDCLTNCQSLGQ